MREIVVRNEKEAFDLLQKALNRELGDKQFVLKFDNWPILSIRLSGKGYDSTITSDVAEALVGVQRAVNRSYARAVHGQANARRLTDSERQEIQFKAKVKRGSSLIEINLGEFAEKLAETVATRMTPEMIAITVVGLAITAASYSVAKAYLKHKSEDKQIEQTERTKLLLSQQETKRMEILAEAMGRQPQLKHANEDFDEARGEILRSGSDARSISVNTIELTAETARAIGSTKRTESVEVQLNGTYTIVATDLRQPDEIRMRVHNVDSGREFSAGFKDNSLKQSQIALLQKAEWDRARVYLSINARTLRGDVTSATVVSVTQQP